MKTISSGRKIKRIISWFLIFLLAPFLLFWAEYGGKVVSVIDRDTIHVLFDMRTFLRIFTCFWIILLILRKGLPYIRAALKEEK
jgi:hypothetical protein